MTARQVDAATDVYAIEVPFNRDTIVKELQDWVTGFEKTLDKSDRVARVVIAVEATKFLPPFYICTSEKRVGPFWLPREPSLWPDEVEEALTHFSTLFEKAERFDFTFKVALYGTQGKHLLRERTWILVK